MLTQVVYGLMAEHPTAEAPRQTAWLERVGRAAKMETEPGPPDDATRHRVLLMLDEFASLGKLEILQEALAYCAGYGVKAYLIVQGLEQLYAAYGRNESIVGNCHIRVAFAPNKIETAQLLSKMTGTTTVQSHRWAGKKRQKHFHARPLLTPDECMRLRLPEKDRTTDRVSPGRGADSRGGSSADLRGADPLLSRCRVRRPCGALTAEGLRCPARPKPFCRCARDGRRASRRGGVDLRCVRARAIGFALVGLLGALLTAEALGLRLNLAESMPVGLYRLAPCGEGVGAALSSRGLGRDRYGRRRPLEREAPVLSRSRISHVHGKSSGLVAEASRGSRRRCRGRSARAFAHCRSCAERRCVVSIETAPEAKRCLASRFRITCLGESSGSEASIATASTRDTLAQFPLMRWPVARRRYGRDESGYCGPVPRSAVRLGWSGRFEWLPVAALVLILWRLCRSRLEAFGVAAAYYGAPSFGWMQASSVFFRIGRGLFDEGPPRVGRGGGTPDASLGASLDRAVRVERRFSPCARHLAWVDADASAARARELV